MNAPGAPLPARGPRILVTRPQPQADEWVQRLQGLGVDAVAVPLLALWPAADAGPVRDAWRAIAGEPGAAPRLVMFVSPGAVSHFFAARPDGAAWPASVHAGATGPGTASALLDAGVPRSAIEQPAEDAPQFDSEALWRRIAGWPWAGATVLVVRGEDGRDWLADQLAAAGAQVRFVAAYRRGAPSPSPAQDAAVAEALARPRAHVWLFSSSEAVGHLAALRPRADWSASRAWATHPRIAQTARDAGFGEVTRVSPQPQAVKDEWTRSIQSTAQ